MLKIKIISILLFSMLMLSSCGFKPLDQKNNNLIYIQNVDVVGETRIAYTIKNNILLISNNNSKNKYSVKVEIQKKKRVKTKNKTGKITRYSLFVSTKLELTNLNDSKKIVKLFTQNKDFDREEDYSNTINNENDAIKNIIEQISDDIVNFITLTMRNL